MPLRKLWPRSNFILSKKAVSNKDLSISSLFTVTARRLSSSARSFVLLSQFLLCKQVSSFSLQKGRRDHCEAFTVRKTLSELQPWSYGGGDCEVFLE